MAYVARNIRIRTRPRENETDNAVAMCELNNDKGIPTLLSERKYHRGETQNMVCVPESRHAVSIQHVTNENILFDVKLQCIL